MTWRGAAHVLFRQRWLSGGLTALGLLLGAIAAALSWPDASGLARARAELAAFQQSSGIIAAQAQMDQLVARRGEVESGLALAQTEQAQLARQVEILRGQLAQTPAEIELLAETERSAVVEDAQAKLFDLRSREQELLGRYTPTSTFVTAIRGEIRQVEAFLRAQDDKVQARSRRGANPLYQQIQSDLARAETGLAAAQSRAQTLTAQLRDTVDSAAGIAAAEGRLAQLRADLTAAQAQQGSRLLALLLVPLGLFAGAALGALAAWVAELSSSVLVTPQRAEKRLGLRVLAAIPLDGSR